MPRLTFRLPWRSAERLRDELDDELRFHADERTRELVAQGMSERDARAAAEREFGDLGALRRECLAIDHAAQRAARRGTLRVELADDLRAAWRSARRSAGSSLLAVLALALGIGGTTAIFSAVNGVLLEQLPYGEPDRLVRVWSRDADGTRERGQIAAGDFVDFQARQRTLTGLAAFAYARYVWTGADEPVSLQAVRVSPNLFDVLEAPPALGRAFVAGEDQPGHDGVVLLTHGAWQRHFGGDPAAVGRTMTLNGVSRTVVGVLPRSFQFAEPHAGPVDVYVPLRMEAVLRDANRARKFRWLGAVGRLRPGMTAADAHADLSAIAADLGRAMPESNGPFLAMALPLRDAVVGEVRPALLVLLGASAFLLLIACANVGGVQLSRAVARRREFAIRAALGAGRARLVRQSLLESVLLAVAGGALGLLLAHYGMRALLSLADGAIPRTDAVDVDGRVLAFTVVVSVATGLLFGLAPAVGGTRLSLQGTLQDAARGATRGPSGLRLRGTLVLAQAALAVMLLVGAGLLGRSLLQLQNEDFGFRTEQVLTFGISLPGDRYPDDARQNAFYEALHERLRSLPGVVSAASTGVLPTRGGSSASLFVAGRDVDGTVLPEVGYNAVSAGFFDALRIPLRRGRAFDAGDHADAPLVLVVNESLARQHFPDGDVLGARIRLGPDPSEPLMTVVGVVGDVRQHGVEARPRPAAYVHTVQESWSGRDVVLRTAGDPAALADAVRREVRALDAGLPVRELRTFESLVASSLDPRRLLLYLMGGFAATALLLAALGVYSVTAYAVAARRREFGVRMALGASRGRVLRLALRQGSATAVAGIVLGLVGAAALTRLLAGLLYGVTPLDPATFVAVPAVLALVVVGACLGPAHRATRVDPVVTLRSD